MTRQERATHREHGETRRKTGDIKNGRCLKAAHEEIPAAPGRDACTGIVWSVAVPGVCEQSDQNHNCNAVAGAKTVVTIHEYELVWDDHRGCVLKPTDKAKDVEVDSCSGDLCG